MIEAWNKTYPEPRKPTMYKFTTIMILFVQQHVLKILDPENARPVEDLRTRLAHMKDDYMDFLDNEKDA